MSDLPAGPVLDQLLAETLLPSKSWFVSSPRSDSVVVYKGVPWMPSTDIVNAWEVVELMRLQGFVVNIRSPGVITVGDGYYKHDQWYTVFQSGAQEAAAVYDKEGEAHADTAALAICLAGLAAVGSEP